MSPLEITVYIFGSIIIIFAAYFVTYFIGSKSMKLQRGRMFQMLDRISISKSTSICLIKIGDCVYVVAVTNQNVTMLDKLDPSQVEGLVEDRKEQAPAGLGIPKAFKSLWRREGSSGLKTKPPEPKKAFKPGDLGLEGQAKVVDLEKSEKPKKPVKPENPEAFSLEMAQEEDDLDLVFRKIQSRRSREDNPPDKEGGL